MILAATLQRLRPLVRAARLLCIRIVPVPFVFTLPTYPLKRPAQPTDIALPRSGGARADCPRFRPACAGIAYRVTAVRRCIDLWAAKSFESLMRRTEGSGVNFLTVLARQSGANERTRSQRGPDSAGALRSWRLRIRIIARSNRALNNTAMSVAHEIKARSLVALRPLPRRDCTRRVRAGRFFRPVLPMWENTCIGSRTIP